MKRRLLRSNSFVRSAKRLFKKNPQLIIDLQASLESLAEDAFMSSLKNS